MRGLFLFWLLVFATPSFSATNNFLDSLVNPASQSRFLPVEQAFVFNFSQQNDTFSVSWDIAPGYYLYKDKTELIAKNATISVQPMQQGEIIQDEFFGETEVFFNSLSVTSTLSEVAADAMVKIRYQGCAEAGLCYPPEIISIPISTLAKAQTSANHSAPQQLTAPVKPNTELSFTERLEQQSLLTNLAVFFVLGIGLAFTPCVFPMFPILSSLIAGQQHLSTKKAFALSFTYVQGMAVTYALLGLVIAALGGHVQGYLQHPYVLISFSLLFVLLAMSMFGWYEIKLPSGMMSKLTQISNQQQGGNYAGVFLMGVLSGLIASPCTTAPLSATLLFVAQSGDYVVGGLTLYILSLGMGLPLLLLGSSGGKLLPKAGAWMTQVKTLFGFVMLIVPLILLERILSTDIILLLAGVLALATALYLHFWQSQQQHSYLKTALWFVATLLVIVGVKFAATPFYGTTLLPAQRMPVQVNTAASPLSLNQTDPETGLKQFNTISNLAQLNEIIAQANTAGYMVMVDLYADWCVACKEFEHYTFVDAKVQSEFQHYVLVQIDLTETNDTSIEFMEQFNVFGLPSILFFNHQGSELTKQRVTGFLNAKDFAQHLAAVRASAQ